MSKMGEMSATIEDLRRCAAAISDAVNWLAEQFSGDDQKPEAAALKTPLRDGEPLGGKAFAESDFATDDDDDFLN